MGRCLILEHSGVLFLAHAYLTALVVIQQLFHGDVLSLVFTLYFVTIVVTILHSMVNVDLLLFHLRL